MSLRCLGTQRCGDDVLGRASSEQSQGHGGDSKLNAPTVPCLQTNTRMTDSPSEEEGGRDQRGAMTVPGSTSEPLNISARRRKHAVHNAKAQTALTSKLWL